MDDPMASERSREVAVAKVRWQVVVNIAEQLAATMTLRRKIRDRLTSSASPLAISAQHRAHAN